MSQYFTPQQMMKPNKLKCEVDHFTYTYQNVANRNFYVNYDWNHDISTPL
jgi:hypothetical protein